VIVNETGVTAVLVAVSVALTLYAPAGLLGTVNLQTNAPLASVWIAVVTQTQFEPPVGVWRTPLKLSVAPEA
jgi:hypothetical protein